MNIILVLQFKNKDGKDETVTLDQFNIVPRPNDIIDYGNMFKVLDKPYTYILRSTNEDGVYTLVYLEVEKIHE